ncbi:hypothetical protein [Amaricoccus solimangrovi]|uniref:XRE family transcriptional regulator n=1 Tax=Amaricoccus solimangrovi TaxID=2589815 RepID=A0A501WZA8_9RHOB|nr:hypothetical protein [Amaricoccus solimangrovi]TPE53057.1 hypothetical protein FJM51_03255 [Amaricoccus solimangrovi]
MEKDIDPVTLAVIRNVSAIMEEKEMKPADVKRAGGLGQSTMHDLLVRHRSPGVDTLGRIAAGLSEEPYVLLLEPSKRDALRRALRTFGKADADDLLRIEAMVEAFLGSSAAPQLGEEPRSGKAASE